MSTLIAPTLESGPTQCRGSKTCEPCNQAPRFRVDFRDEISEWSCGWHVTSSMLWISDQHADGAALQVQVIS